MFASSCQKDEGGLKPQMRKVTVRASLAETKVALSGAQLQWENGDELALVFPHETEAWHVCGLSATIEDEAAPTRAKFRGSLDKSVTVDNGYAATGFAVYPRTAVAGDGSIAFLLPTEQVAAETVDDFAGVQRGLNLTSGNVPLKKIVNKGETDSYFKNACSVLRFTLAEGVASMTLTGTSNLTGQAPLVLNSDGRLVVDAEGEWSNGSQSVTIKPYNGEGFENGTAYNLLVWPGEHTALTLSVDYLGDYGTVSKTTQLAAVFEPSKYYTLNFDVSSDVLLRELNGALDNTIDGLTAFEGELKAAEDNINVLVSQIQSVSLMSEYLDNYVYAPYGNFSIGGLRKEPVSLNYLVRPASAAEALVEAFKQDNTIVNGLLGYSKSTGFEVTGINLPVDNLAMADINGVDGVVTATINLSYVSNEVYQGKYGAAVALQIKSDEAKVDIHSEFAKLIPHNGTLFSCSYINNVPAIQGAKVSIPFTYTLADPSVSPLTVTANGVNVESAYANLYTGSMSGNLNVVFSESYPIEEQTVTLELTVGTEVITKEFTFVDSGASFEIVSPGEIDYVGGDFVIDVTSAGTQSYNLTASGTGISNNATLFSFDENTGGARTMTIGCNATIPGVSLTYYKSITVTQKAYGSQLTGKYYSNGDRINLNNATAACSNYFNVVILGDGFTTKDLNEGGKFEQRARSAMDSFFGIEPYKSFKDRFNVIAVAYKSNQSGTDITDAAIERDTYFDSHGQNGSTALSASRDKVINVVKNTLGYSSDDQFFRTIVILLVNTDLNSGSTVYTENDRVLKPGFVNGYASFAFACVAANSSGTSGLIKHEAGGHAFGRLADEYVLSSGVTADADKKAELDSFHQKGWYWNVTHNKTTGYYNFTNKYNAYPGVDFIEGAWNVSYGIYRSSEGGMMLNNNGNFNAISRHAIYHRIITESEDVSAYSWEKFYAYDAINR